MINLKNYGKGPSLISPRILGGLVRRPSREDGTKRSVEDCRDFDPQHNQSSQYHPVLRSYRGLILLRDLLSVEDGGDRAPVVCRRGFQDGGEPESSFVCLIGERLQDGGDWRFMRFRRLSWMENSETTTIVVSRGGSKRRVESARR
ncbi:unnamed protein product [Microthlaspi erraticum]|uniref:Uncharacterized protein n=1 Tax=Microthlaspi erraticum TaxID=1685480 RepID=A0A6D2JQ40_9BRAS|nr:unnamed protein product [Microthlaspi erraticum]